MSDMMMNDPYARALALRDVVDDRLLRVLKSVGKDLYHIPVGGVVDSFDHRRLTKLQLLDVIRKKDEFGIECDVFTLSEVGSSLLGIVSSENAKTDPTCA